MWADMGLRVPLLRVWVRMLGVIQVSGFGLDVVDRVVVSVRCFFVRLTLYAAFR